MSQHISVKNGPWHIPSTMKVLAISDYRTHHSLGLVLMTSRFLHCQLPSLRCLPYTPSGVVLCKIWYCMLYIDTIHTHTHTHTHKKTGNNFQRQMDWNNYLFLPNTENLMAKKNCNWGEMLLWNITFRVGSYYKERCKRLDKMDTFPKTVSFRYCYLSFKEKGYKWNILILHLSWSTLFFLILFFSYMSYLILFRISFRCTAYWLDNHVLHKVSPSVFPAPAWHRT